MQEVFSTKKRYSISLVSVLIFLTAISLIIYLTFDHYFLASNKEIVTIYPDNLETKIKPLKTAETPLKYEQILGKYNNNLTQKFDLQPEPEQPLEISSLFPQKQKYIDPIDNIISNIITNNEEQAPTKSTSDSSSLNIIKITEKTNTLAKVKTKKEPTQYKYKIQLASVKSEAEGIIIWEKLKSQHPKLLGNLTMIMHKISNDRYKFYYMLMINGYNNLNQAKNICRQLTKSKQYCIVIE